ncbi:COG8 Conserved oligomeric Golgi complex subunit 8 [Candida maltosa Xu316]|uniref:Conserved oligomeric Golgi complex subunit 8 n=1 Tax=Candida maltosa (strain Xu316) TaxID=1245528 RepID=M3IMB2_CANMX|nr:hypothetical protein G210_2120 [Candida maltosa Xu316]
MSSLLLDSLKDGLDDEYIQLLNSNPKFAQEAETYLQELLINDDLLSTDPYTTTSETEVHKKTLIEEIAELDMIKHDTNVKLSSITSNNRDLIIDISNDLQFVTKQMREDYPQAVDTLLKNLSDDLNMESLASQYNLKSTIDINNTILNKIDSVLDILELPTLCKLCILQGNYQESLEISIYIQSLMIRYPKITLFQQINQQIDQELQVMVKGLIKLLNTNLKQNHVLKIFQILNKLFDTSRNSDLVLIKIYLNSRFKFILNEVSSLKPLIKFNKLTYLKRYIEIYREFIFSSLSVYNIIFKNNSQDVIIGQFVRSLINLLCQEFKRYLPDIKSQKSNSSYETEIDLASSIDGLILQLIYLCRSLASFHLDFEPIILLELVSPDLIPESDWLRNITKIKTKHR